jgi:hypothetical protein
MYAVLLKGGACVLLPVAGMLVVTILDVQLCQTDGADNASGAVPFF